MIEIVIAFVIQALDQINLTIASTSESDPLSLCMYMHRSTLVPYIHTYQAGFVRAYVLCVCVRVWIHPSIGHVCHVIYYTYIYLFSSYRYHHDT